MKIKISYGIDMRLWRQKGKDDEPSTYQDLLDYICQTFQFDDTKQFKITFKDDDDTQTTIASADDFKDAVNFAKNAEKKSLKLYITDSVQKHHHVQDDEKKESVPIKSNISGSNNDQNAPQNDKNTAPPSPEQINAFLSDDFVIDLLSDLFVSVFEALQSSNFEVSFIECVQGIILSSNEKYDKITSNPIWPYFMDQLLPKMDHFVVPFMMKMMKMNGSINTEMIKQWIPTLLNMMKQRAQNGDNGPMFGGNKCNGFGWRGRRGRGWRHNHRGRGWRGHRRGHHGHGHHHGHHGNHGQHHGHRGHHGFGYNPWFQSPQNHDNGEGAGYNGYPPSAPAMGNNQNEDDQIEEEAFEFTEELVAIMNMGFTNINKIKKLLVEHKGNKQNVVQELVLEK